MLFFSFWGLFQNLYNMYEMHSVEDTPSVLPRIELEPDIEFNAESVDSHPGSCNIQCRV